MFTYGDATAGAPLLRGCTTMVKDGSTGKLRKAVQKDAEDKLVLVEGGPVWTGLDLGAAIAKANSA